MQTTKLLALSLVIVLSPKLAMKDAVGSFARTKVEAAGSTAGKVETPQARSQAGTTTTALSSVKGRSGHVCTCPAKPKLKGRWGYPRRVPLLRRPFSKSWLMAAQSPSFPLGPDSASSFPNWSGVSGLANR